MIYRCVIHRPLGGIAFLLFIAIVGCCASASAQWTDVTPSALANAGMALGVAWADYDGDGDLDLYVTRYGESNLLLRNDGAGVLSDVTPGILADTGLSIGAAWGDSDGDGYVDLAWADDEGSGSRFARNVGGGVFIDASETPLTGTYLDHAVSWADFDQDGDLDLYVGGHEPNRLLRNDGDLVFAMAPIGPLADPDETYGVTWGDYDDDGDLDVYVTNRGPNRLLRNDGGAGFVDVSTSLLADTGWGRGAEWIDYDNDGDLDLYLTNDGAANRLFRNDGGTFALATPTALADAGFTKGMAWADYDNDGDLDVYLTDRVADKLFRNEGGGIFVDATAGPLVGATSGGGVAWGDIDGDGDIDLVVTGFDAPSHVFRNDQTNPNHWLIVQLHGNLSNAAGIGARIQIATASGIQIREITSGSGWVSQNPAYAHFGLGSDTTVDSITIRWPSGTQQVVQGVPVDTKITIPEQPGTTAAPPRLDARRPILHPASPNPFNPSTRIAFELPAATTVRLEVFDLKGRRVRTLVHGLALDAGPHSRTWDGRDDGGAALSSGVYLVRLTADGWNLGGSASLLK